MATIYGAPLRYPVVVGDALMRRALHEFDEMPSLRLTFAQAMRLWNLDPLVCQKLLDVLVRARLLCIDADGRYGRAPNGMARESPWSARKSSAG